MRARSSGLHPHGWLEQIKQSGPFLTVPIAAETWPEGMPAVSQTVRATIRAAVAQLLEVGLDRQREQLLLAAEVPVDDRPVDPDGLGDLVDLGVADPGLVEEPPGRGEDLPLAVSPARGRRGLPARRTRGRGGVLDGRGGTVAPIA